MSGVNYVAATVELRSAITPVLGQDPVDYIERPGSGEPPIWVFIDGFRARGGAAAEAYLKGLSTGLRVAGRREN